MFSSYLASDEIFREKHLKVAWFVSHCETQSKREDYVARLAKVIQVDIFGACGKMACGKYGFEMGGQKESCMDMLSRDYKYAIVLSEGSGGKKTF